MYRILLKMKKMYNYEDWLKMVEEEYQELTTEGTE